MTATREQLVNADKLGLRHGYNNLPKMQFLIESWVSATYDKAYADGKELRIKLDRAKNASLARRSEELGQQRLF